MCVEGKCKVRRVDVQFLLPALQAEITLTTGMTQGWEFCILAYLGVIFDNCMLRTPYPCLFFTGTNADNINVHWLEICFCTFQFPPCTVRVSRRM
jgi:hypothetical protein